MTKKKLQLVFGQVVRRARQEQGISQEELAAQAGLHRTYISPLERGLRNPSLSVITQLADALKTPPSHLVATFDAERRGV